MESHTTVIAPDFLMPPRARPELVEPTAAGIATEARLPRLFPWCFRFTRRFSTTAEPLVVTGTCLAPWLQPGDVVWFDRELEPQIGELVACRLRYRCREGLARGQIVELIAIKKLVLVGSSVGLAANEDVLDARDAEILGPVTAWHRRGWRRPSIRKMNLPPAGVRLRD